MAAILQKYLSYLLLVLFIAGAGVIGYVYMHNLASVESDRQETLTIVPLSSQRAPNLSVYRPLGLIAFDKDRQVLVDSVRSNHVNTGVAYRKDIPMLTEVAQKEAEQTERTLPVPEVVPWFYFSPNVAKISPYSRANDYQLIKKEAINAFEWYRKQDNTYLFHEGKLYTGWYRLPFDGWYYFEDGLITGNRVTNADTLQWNRLIQRITDLTPLRLPRPIYLEDLHQYAFNTINQPRSYSILYKNTQGMILTSPPGTKGSALLTTTENFADMPMEVVEEVQTPDGAWLHVNIGYEELGWVPKDETGTDYVPTYYSERALLDRIQSIFAEEIAQMNARVGASFVNDETMSQISYQNQLFFPASTQKIYVLGELYHQYRIGTLSPDTVVTLTDADKVPGAGIIQDYPNGSQFTLEELVDLVVSYSDNTAANLIIDTVGGGEVINPHIHQMGLNDTYIQGKYYGGASTYFTTSPADAARFFALLANNQVNGEPWDGMLIGKFAQNTHTFLRQLTPWDGSSWNKSGLGSTEQNDVATFITDFGEYSIAVYTAEPANYDIIGEQVAFLSLRVRDAFNEERSKLWITVGDEGE